MINEMQSSNQETKVWVTGHNGLLGSAIVNLLIKSDFEVLTVAKKDLDLRDRVSVDAFYEAKKPDFVIHCAAVVGGIEQNRKMPVEFLSDNILISTNVINAAHSHNVKQLINIGSSCMFPRNAAQPIREISLLQAPLEPTNEAFAIAKIASVKLVEFYRNQHNRNWVSVVPANLYGMNDHFDVRRGHVIPALIKKMHEAKLLNKQSVDVWGTGSPIRQFLYVEDAARVILNMLGNKMQLPLINIAGHNEISIKELVSVIKDVVGYPGAVKFDTLKPDGMPRKALDGRNSAMYFDFEPEPFGSGLSKTYQYFLNAANG
jgi:GDP-L-fucose synthase